MQEKKEAKKEESTPAEGEPTQKVPEAKKEEYQIWKFENLYQAEKTIYELGRIAHTFKIKQNH